MRDDHVVYCDDNRRNVRALERQQADHESSECRNVERKSDANRTYEKDVGRERVLKDERSDERERRFQRVHHRERVRVERR